MADTPPVVLTIAGSDSGAGAGIQADLKTIAAFSCYGTTVLTALTAQNTLGVQSVERVSTAMVEKQLESVLVDDIGAQAIKTGMLYDGETIRTVVEVFERHFGPRTRRSDRPVNLVVDPVCVSTSGHSLLDPQAVDSLRTNLLPWATIVTPNIPEAEFLVNASAGSIKSVDDMRRVAKELASRGVRWVYLKGGHMPIEKADGTKVVVDLLWDAEGEQEYLSERKYLDVNNTHGTGCTLAAAIASGLAKGQPVPDAVEAAADYVAYAIAAAYPLGRGSGPVNHFHSHAPRSIPLPNPHSRTPFVDYLISYNRPLWDRYVHHPFPQGLADGTMPLSSFLHFIQQDYHFLKQYGRTNSLAAYKTEDMKEMEASIEIVNAVIKETEMHVAYCETYGISRAELQAVPESLTNIAYTRYVLDTSSKGDLLDTRVVTAPCLIGYGQVGERLVNAIEGVERDETKNRYWGWIKEYGGDWYQGAVKTGIDLLESTLSASPISSRRLEELAKVFETATMLEIAFWDAAIEAGKEREGRDETR
ncbi:hypothetical protein JCM10212_000230 [Sporobolomyces blumeae]